MKSRPIILAAVALFIIVFAILRMGNQPHRSEYKFYPMGGIPCRVVEYGAPSKDFDGNMKELEARVDELENIFNPGRPESEVTQLNNSQPNTWIPLSKEMYDIMEKSLTWYGRTDGAFDVTVASLIGLWKDAEIKGRLPTKEETDNVLLHTGSSYLTLSPEKGVEFSRNNMKFDFGGIAKGYILDKIGMFLLDHNVDKFVVSCGGDVIMKGKEQFRVGIQEPGGGEDSLMMVLTLPPAAVVTSGHYERYYKIGDEKYSHIMDPKTGWPVKNDLVSITVVADSTTDADALATALAVLGFDKARDFLKRTDDYKVILLKKVGEGYEIYYSKPLSAGMEFVGKWKDVPRHEL